MKKKKLIISLCVVLGVLVAGAFAVYAAAYDSASDPLVALSYITDVLRPSVDKDIDSVSDKVASAEEKIAALEKSLAGGTFDPSEIENRLDVLEEADSDSKEQLDDMTLQLNTVLASLEEAKAQLDEAKGDLDALRGEQESANAELQNALNGKASSARVEELSLAVEQHSERVDNLIETYGLLLDALLAERVPSQDTYGYTTVTLKAGQRLICSEPCSMMLRGGEGIYSFESTAYDATAAAPIESGAGAAALHIVIFDGASRFTASENGATVMVKGEYTVE